MCAFAIFEIALSAALVIGAPIIALRPKHRPPTKGTLARMERSAREMGAIVETVSFAGAGGTKLVGTYAHRPERSRAVLLLHGFGGHRLQLDALALPLLAAGYDVLMLDLRAHGESEGDRVTFGRLESEDSARAADFLESRGDTRLYMVGASYGGAVALASAARDPRWRALAVGATFAYYRSTALGYGKAFLGLSDFAAKALLTLPAEVAVRSCGREARADLEMIEPISSVRRVRAPLLVIHGERDPGIGCWQARDLVRACPAPRRDLWIVPGAGHDQDSLLDVSAAAVADRVRRWFDASELEAAPSALSAGVLSAIPAAGR